LRQFFCGKRLIPVQESLSKKKAPLEESGEAFFAMTRSYIE
jgi:hypothetical protein